MIPLHDDNPTTIRPIVTVSFIAACVLVFVWQVSHDARGQQLVVYSLGAIPAVLFGERQLPTELAVVPAYVTLITSMFMHGGWMHLLGNMLYLWIFGNNVEDAMGHVRFVMFYLLCGIAAAMSHAIPNADSVIPMVGASGAISGILGAYVLLHPRARVLILIPLGFFSQLIYVRAVTVLGIWFALQLISSVLRGGEGGGIAFGAHIGGFVAGMVLIPFFKHRDVRLENPLRGFTR
jgi:membrane associated rhomboid family serine protease